MHYERWCGNFYVFDLEFFLFLVYGYKVYNLKNPSCNYFTDQDPETFIFFWSQLSHLLLFLYRRNFSYPHKHNVIQTAEVTTALGWPWDEHELPPLALPCLRVTTAPSPHSSAGSEQHLQEKWLFLLFPAITGSLIPTVFVSVPQCCLTREGWALLLPQSSRDTGVGCWLQHRFLLSTFL